jgi:pyruvate/2-oxoglutarate dehydrogenase complex dihydrolipoamide acyltransferase (E2) component
MMSLSLAVDRTVISETYAAEFLMAIKDGLEHPRGLI